MARMDQAKALDLFAFALPGTTQSRKLK